MDDQHAGDDAADQGSDRRPAPDQKLDLVLLRQQTTLARFGELALQSESLDEILQEACRLVAAALETDLAKVLELQPDGRTLLVRAGVGWEPGVVGRARVEAQESSSEGHAIQTGEPVICNDLDHETRFDVPRFLVEHGVKALANVMIVGARDQPAYGVLQVDSREPRQFDENDIAFLRTYANLVAAAVARLRVLAEVRRDAAFSEAVLAASPDCIKVLETDGTLLFMNEQGLRQNEIADPATVIGRNFAELWPPDVSPRIQEAIARAAAGGIGRAEGYAPTSRGAPRWREVHFAPLPAVNGEPMRLVGVSRDVTQRVQAETQQRDSEERLRAIFEAAPIGIVVAEAPHGRIIAGNPQAEIVFGHSLLSSPDVESYKNWVSFHADGRRVLGREYPLARALRGEQRPSLEVQYQFDDGSRGWIGLSAAPIRNPAGAITGAIVTAQNIELQKRAEAVLRLSNTTLQQQIEARTRDLADTAQSLAAEIGSRHAAEGQVRQLQKMEAVGQLTGGIAHDFNNMLAVVISALNLVQRRLSKGETDVARFTDAAMDAAVRAGALTQRLLAFSRQQSLSPETLDCNRLVAGLSDLLRRTLGEEVLVETVLAGELWPTRADVSQLESALLNLAVNARDAMPSGGRLTIETANCHLDDAYAREHEEVEPGQYVLVAVSDTGVGMPADVIGRVFDPFFTTKEIGRGTGLGLSQVYGFVKQSGGHIKIYSETGRGTAVKIYLPRRYGETATDRPRPPSRPIATGQSSDVVLVVEDEARVRELTVAALRELDYTVVHANGAIAALQQLDAHPDVTVLFTDIVMPGMDGRALADEARRRRPDLRVLFTTGYTRNAMVHNGGLDPGMSVLPKPFNLDQLALKIREVIEAA